MFHITLFKVLLKVIVFGALLDGPMKSGLTAFQLPCASRCESRMDVLRVAYGDIKGAPGGRCVSRTSNCIRHVNAPCHFQSNPAGVWSVQDGKPLRTGLGDAEWWRQCFEFQTRVSHAGGVLPPAQESSVSGGCA